MEVFYLAEGDDLVFAGKDNMETVSSLYLSPHYTSRGEELCEVKNVFTKEKFRRRGYMDTLMKEAFSCMQSEAEAYTYLRPMNPKYFTPYGFVEVERREGYRINGLIVPDKLLKEANESGKRFSVTVKESEVYDFIPLSENIADEAAAFVNSNLKRLSDCYILESGHTLINRQNALKQKGGNLYVIQKENRTVCVFAYSLVKQEIVNEENGNATKFSDKLTEFVLTEENFPITDLFIKEPEDIVTLARIIDVRKMFSTAVSPKEFVMVLKVYDERLVENAGLYMLHCSPLGGRVTAIKIGNTDLKNAEGERLSAEGEVTMENLTRFLFGYKKAEDCFKIYVKSKEEDCFNALNSLNCIEHPYFICG